MQYKLTEQIPYQEATELWEHSANADVFNHPGCWRALLESGVHPGRLACIEVRDNYGTLQAAWPFIIKRGGAKDLFARIAEPLGAHYLDYIAPITKDIDNRAIWACLTSALREIFNSTGKMRLPKLTSNELRFLMNGEGLNPFFSCFEALVSPRLLFGASYEETEQALGWRKKHRPSVRLRRMQKEGSLSLWIAKDSNDIKDRFPKLFELHRERWHNQGRPSQFDRLEERACFRAFAEYIPDGLLHYSELRLENNVISAHFGFLSNSWLYWYKPAHDVGYNKFSPGMLHIAMLARHGVEHGWRGIDFLQGDESYKFRWANDEKQTDKLTISNASGYLWWFWETRLRHAVRERFINLKKGGC